MYKHGQNQKNVLYNIWVACFCIHIHVYEYIKDVCTMVMHKQQLIIYESFFSFNGDG